MAGHTMGAAERGHYQCLVHVKIEEQGAQGGTSGGVVIKLDCPPILLDRYAKVIWSWNGNCCLDGALSCTFIWVLASAYRIIQIMTINKVALFHQSRKNTLQESGEVRSPLGDCPRTVISCGCDKSHSQYQIDISRFLSSLCCNSNWQRGVFGQVRSTTARFLRRVGKSASVALR
jgi:hypothetical protein